MRVLPFFQWSAGAGPGARHEHAGIPAVVSRLSGSEYSRSRHALPHFERIATVPMQIRRRFRGPPGGRGSKSTYLQRSASSPIPSQGGRGSQGCAAEFRTPELTGRWNEKAVRLSRICLRFARWCPGSGHWFAAFPLQVFDSRQQGLIHDCAE